MDRNDQQAIEQLFGKLQHVESQSPPRDSESESYIREKISNQPGAPYYMAQTIVVQEQALEAAQARIEQLEAEAAAAPRQSGGLFGGLFGGGAQPPRRGSVPQIGRRAGPQGGYGQQAGYGQGAMPMQGQQRGGGFLAGAAQTAMGVAGGVLLANAIGGMFGADEAQAAEAPAEDPGMDDAGGFDDGGFGDMEF